MTETATESPLLRMTKTTRTVLWNDSATLSELSAAIGWGAVGATCNPVIALAALRSDLPRWQQRIAEYAAENPTADESAIGWAIYYVTPGIIALFLKVQIERRIEKLKQYQAELVEEWGPGIAEKEGAEE